jgi:anti-sigma B factor antagonist
VRWRAAGGIEGGIECAKLAPLLSALNPPIPCAGGAFGVGLTNPNDARLPVSTAQSAAEGGHSDPPPRFAVRRMIMAEGYRLVVRGEVDLATAPTLADRVTEAERDRPRALEVDLAEVSFMSAAGVRVLLDAAHRAQSEGRRLVVVNPQPPIRRLFALLEVDRLLDIRFE